MANKHRNRAYYRDVRQRHITRKKRIISETDCWYVKYDGMLSHGKIHCSCGLCMAKTRNKDYKRRHIHGNYAPNINYKHSDLQKIESLVSQLKELDEIEAERDCYKDYGIIIGYKDFFI